MSIDDVEAKVRALEVELQKATERSRLAKKAVKDAKALAKEAKKDKRRARRALIAAQEEHDIALSEGSKPTQNDSSESSDSKQPSARNTPKKLRVLGGPTAPQRKVAGKKAKTVRSAATESDDSAAAKVESGAPSPDSSPGKGEDADV